MESPRAGRASADPDEAHEGEFSVRYRDLDMNGHANNISYLDWFLEILPLSFREGHTIQELEVNFLAEIGGGEAVRSRALAGGSGGLELEHGLTRLPDGEAVARARSRWAPRR